MALVSYDVSDASGSEDEDPETTPAQLLVNGPESSSKKIGNEIVDEGLETDYDSSSVKVSDETLFDEGVHDIVTEDENNLFSVLPTPKTIPSLIDSDFSKKLLLNQTPSLPEKPQKKTVKITVPSLSEFEEDLPTPTVKKVAPSSKGTGLFALLPPPKNSGPAASLKFIPDSLKKSTPLTKPVQKMTVKPIPKVVVPVKKTAPVVLVTEDSDSDDETEGDFLGLNRPVNPDPVVVLPTILPDVVPLEEHIIAEGELQFTGPEVVYESSDFIPVQTDNLSLDEEAISKLCGGSKRKRTAMQAELIDIDETEIRPDQDEWLVKAITEEKPTRSHKKSGGPSGLSKRKHQITYLAYQAKANEQDLKNQWSQNMMTKRQTQSKYGF